MYNGIINIYKEAGFTSHDVVAKMRGILKQKKIGHTGTLDPAAVGVLPVCLGSGTKLCDMLTDHDKVYEAVLLLGVETDTQDTTGRVLREGSVDCTEDEVRRAVMSFVGEYDQIPPMYSALKVDGKKLYELAREGKEVDRQARKVWIHSIEILKVQLPRVTMRVACSKGTYIRTLCHDIGCKLGCGGAMEALKRVKVGRFEVQDAITLNELELLRDAGQVEEKVIPVDGVFEDLPAVHVKDAFRKLVQNGNALMSGHVIEPELCNGGQVRIYDEENRFYGVYEYVHDRHRLQPVKMFLGE
ncbi:MAG: tRNA pseudouridine(55) synthase TruB [Lachnospiraceae bacterium]|nr:tRNA pseudouridine(55) synthase TruB [Lachnospiraceae bacterium]